MKLVADNSKKGNAPKPLVYSCSGCSNVAQLANDLAVTLDREGHAEMSCIAGVGGKVKSLVNKAKSGQQIIAIDGCPLNCVKACLAQHDIEPAKHFELTDYKIKKRYGEEIPIAESFRVMKEIYAELGLSKKLELI